MNITKSQIINPGTNEGDKPDAVKIEIAGVTVLVNLHTGVVTIDGSDHVNAEGGENNTLKIHACPSMPATLKEMLAGLDMVDIGPGIRVGVMDGFGDILAGMPGFTSR